MRSNRLFAIVLLLGMTLFPILVGAQNDRGSIAGHVTDRSGGALKGAEIELQPGNITTASNAQGAYYVNGLSPGTYTITVTYVGFLCLPRSSPSAPGKPALSTSRWTSSPRRDQVLVTAERVSGEAEAINEMRTADNILQVLPAEVITSFPMPTWPTPSAACPASLSSATKGKESMSRFAVQNRVSPIPRSTASTSPHRRVAYARLSSMPFLRTSSNPLKSTKLFRPT